jgi:hypothetical protein
MTSFLSLCRDLIFLIDFWRCTCRLVVSQGRRRAVLLVRSSGTGRGGSRVDQKASLWVILVDPGVHVDLKESGQLAV